jgi:oligopeptide/dipeptide ABC transporter ATP-binding protein
MTLPLAPEDTADVTKAAALAVSDLHVQFDTPSAVVRAVRGVSFTLDRGQRLAIVGESGSGKSAMAMALIGLVPPPGRVVSGSVRLGGRELIGLDDRQLSQIRGNSIGLVFQDPMSALDPLRTIGSQFVESIRTHQDISRRTAATLAADLLGEVGVPTPRRRMSDYPHQYSGGMRQRVLIAMAIANEPEVVLADEPTTALDVTTQAQVLDLLARICDERGNALIMITHNLGIVGELCDNANVMYAGQFVESIPATRLFDQPAHPYTKALLNSVIVPGQTERGNVPAIPGAPPDLSVLQPGCAFAARCQVGHDQDICHTEAPPVVEVPGAAGSSRSRCHFATGVGGGAR